jgi:DNA (cytosine-5)-methyltransferase 1
MLNGLDLFSGIGGMSIALQDWVRPIAYCEIDPYCQGILLSRMADKTLATAPIWDNISTFRTNYLLEGRIEIITGGFPCQDISIAGHGKGLAGERSGLFFEIVRLAKEIKPLYIFLENVPAITARGGIEVIRQITEMGYDTRWCVISAEEWVDQKRERWFCLAKSNSKRCDKGPSKTIQSTRKSSFHEESSHYKLSTMEMWASVACDLRTSDGIPQRTHRIKALGNAVVPQQAEEAFKILMGLK